MEQKVVSNENEDRVRVEESRCTVTVFLTCIQHNTIETGESECKIKYKCY